MIIDELFESPQLCPECGGPSFTDLILAEKKDACYHKIKASAKVWPSAYASGRLVQCRKKGAANYGNKSEGVTEGNDDHIWGPQGRFAGDTKVDVGGVTMKRLAVGEKVKYDGIPVTVNSIHPNGQTCEVEDRNGRVYRGVRVRDLNQLGQGMAEGEVERDKHYYLRNNIWRVMDGDELVHEYTPDRYEVVGAKKLLARFDDEGYDVTHVISPMGVVTYLYGKPENDMDEGMMSNPGDEDSPVAQAIIRRILLQRTDLLAKHGPERVGQAVDEVADFVGDVDEIGSSDVSGWVRHVEQMLGNMPEGVTEIRDRRDAYQRDYDNSVAGMGQRQSYAYSQDGGANDEDHSRDEEFAAQYAKKQQYERTGNFWLKKKDTQQHISDVFVGKAAANQAALDLLKQQPELRGNIVITAYGPGEQTG
jgi:hypothetical protein